MQGSVWMPRLMRSAGGCMFTTSAAPDSRRARAAHEQDRVLVDAERRVVDAAW
jgi:hypothetical protein